MKRIKYIVWLSIALYAVVGTSCSDDIFDQDAGTRISPDKHYRTMEDLYSSINGTLGLMQKPTANLILADGLLSDAMNTTSNADLYMREIENHSFSATNPYIDMAQFYKVIVNINEILNNIDKVAKLNPVNLDSFNLHYAKGGLIAYRSYIYLTLCRIYGKAVMINQDLSASPENHNASFISKADMTDMLINQLLPYVYTGTKGELEIKNMVNIKAVLGELYLEKNDYSNAVTYLKLAAESYINDNTQYSLFKVDGALLKDKWKNIFYSSANTLDVYLKLNNDANREVGLENLFVIGFNERSGQRNPVAEWSKNYQVTPSGSLVSRFESQSAKGDLFRGNTITYKYNADKSAIYVNKYSLDEVYPYSAPIIISRAADIHLLLAEALNRSGNSIQALALVNTGFKDLSPRPAEFSFWRNNIGIRKRVALNAKPDPAIADPTALMLAVEDIILEERSMELAFEGKRWFDLVRIATRRNDPDYLASRVAAKFTDPGKAASIRSLLSNPANWYLPTN